MTPRLAIAVLTSLAASCLVTPVVPHTPLLTEHRGAAAAAVCERLQVGVSHRVDVLLALGEPDLRSADDCAFAYVWDEAWMFFAVFGGSGGIGGDVTRHLAFLVAFDSRGLLARKEFRKQPHLQPSGTWYEEIRRWR